MSYSASAAHFSGWFADDGEDYSYLVWATSRFNAPPVVNPGGPYVVAEGSPVTFNAGGTTDPDNNILYFRWDVDGDGDWDSLRSTTRTFTWTVPDNRGYHRTRLEVYDGLHTNVVTVPVMVTNVPPRVTVGGPAIVVTNMLFARACSFSDPGEESRWDVSVEYGDGVKVPLLHTNKAFLFSHAYRTTGVYRVLIHVDDGEHKGTNGFLVTVVDPGPPRMLTLNPPTYDQFEGSSITVTGRFFYPGWTPGTPVNVNWADGTPLTNVTATVTADGGNQWRFTATHIYADNPKTNGGDYIVSANIPAIPFAGTITTPLTVLNYRPSMTANVPTFTLTEGGLLSQGRSFHDPGADTWTIAIDYGDGGFTSFPSTSTIYQLNHRYLDAGNYEASVTVTDDDGAWQSQLINVVVNNAAPIVTGLTTSTNRLNEGGTVYISGTFTSPALLYDTFVAMIDWGDGRPRTAASVTTLNGTTKSFTASHRYLDNNSSNTFVITAYVSDEDGSTNTRSTTLTVSNTAPVVSAGANVGVPVGGSFTSYGSFTDLGSDTFTGRVNYGDGTGWRALPLVNGTFTFSHAFPSNGLYTVTAEITDDGAKGTDSLQVVTGPPRLSITKVTPTVVRLSWPTQPAPFRLQRRATFASTNVWENFSYSVSTANGTNSAAFNVPVAQYYWRLVWP